MSGVAGLRMGDWVFMMCDRTRPLVCMPGDKPTSQVVSCLVARSRIGRACSYSHQFHVADGDLRLHKMRREVDTSLIHFYDTLLNLHTDDSI